MVAGGEIAKVLSETAEGMQKAGLEKPGAGFDGPWNQTGSDLGQEMGKTGEGQPGSGFDGAWNKEDNHDVLNNENKNYDDGREIPKTTLGLGDNLEANETTHIKTINENLGGGVHEKSGVPYKTKEVDLPERGRVEGVFPVFDSIAEVNMPEDMYKKSDKDQFEYCNKETYERTQKDSDFRSKFSDEQVEALKNGENPKGHVWHHNEEPGKMELVEFDVHQQSGHTGGRILWGGGAESRY